MKSYSHIFFIDALDKLSISKDSTLQLALTLKNTGENVMLIFEDQMSFSNIGDGGLQAHEFIGSFQEDLLTVEALELGEKQFIRLNKQVVLHMRLDPPFDTRYLRYLWILRSLKGRFGVKVLNDPGGIATYNEKMVAYESESSIETFVGTNEVSCENFLKLLKDKYGAAYKGVIFKPLDLYQGMGVELLGPELSLKEVLLRFKGKKEELGGAIVIQPFIDEVYKGELRSIYFNGIELGTIVKKPKKGSFLANIASGASYNRSALSEEARKRCDKLSQELAQCGVPWVAFDILGNQIQEANITCPGLLVEVSKAYQNNLAIQLSELMNEYLKRN